MIAPALAAALLLGGCLYFGLPSASRWGRGLAVGLYVALIGTVYAGSIDLLGAPKPVRLEWRTMGKVTVLSSSIVEGKAIYVWLQRPQVAEPRAYVLPWDMQAAQQLQNAMRQREQSGATVRMAPPAHPRASPGTPKFYAEPQRPPPPKDDPAGDAAHHESGT